MTFRGLTENRQTRQYEVFSTLDNHVKVPVVSMASIASPFEIVEAHLPTGVAVRTWTIMARQFDPELRRADL